MKKTLLMLVLLCLLPVAALADTIIEIPEIKSSYQLLVDGDIIHILGVYEYKEYRPRQDQPFIYSEMRLTCFELNEQNELEPCQDNCVSLYGEPSVVDDTENMFSTMYLNYPDFRPTYQHHDYQRKIKDNTLYINLWSPSKGNVCENIATIPLEQFGGNPLEEDDGIAVTVYNNTIYLVIDKSEGILTKEILYAYDIPSGKTKEIYKSGFEVFSIEYADNQYVLLWTQRGYELLNLSTGKIEKSCKGFSDPVVDIIPDGNEGFYMLCYTGLYKVDHDLKEERFFQLPDGILPRGYLIYRPDKHDFVFLAGEKDSDARSLYIIDEGRSAQNTLTLIDFSNDLGAMNSFAPSMEEFHSTHDQFTVVTAENFTGYDQLNQALVLGDESFDVMLLDANLIHLPNLYRKGYFADLSDMDAIRKYVASAYPAFREASMAGDKIAALPLIASESILMVNQPLWEELGLSIPTTYGELLDTIAHCLEEGILNEHPLFQSDRFELDARGQVISWNLMAPTESYNTLWAHLLQSYIGTSQRKGELTFQDGTIMTLMTQLRGMKDKLDKHDAHRVVGDALLFPYGQLTHITGDKFYDQEAFHPLLLGVHDAEDIAVPVRLKVMLINPRSSRIDLAKEYLAYFAAHPTSTTRCVITTEQPDGIEKPGTFASKESDASFEEEMLSRIEAAKAENDLMAVRDLEDQLAKFKESRFVNWDVMPESAQAYYQVTPYLVVMDSENLGFIDENGGRDIAAFDEGRIDAKTLCQRLEQLLMMRRMENQ